MRIRPVRILVAAVIAAGGYVFRGYLTSLLFRAGEPPENALGLSLRDLGDSDLTVVARDLEVPWEIAFLPDGGLLVTERPGWLTRLVGDARRSFPVEGVHQAGESGLMGLALHPEFATNSLIYLYYTISGGRGLENRVVRYRLGSTGLTNPTVIVSGIPGERFHDGGRIAFGPDGSLYITTGDGTDGAIAQDRKSLGGKILRVTAEGAVPADNPFGNAVYSYGHRNPQGLAWGDRQRLWSTEHGRSVGGSGYDELNLIEKGANYGWPAAEGDQQLPGAVPPVLHSGPDYTWAPAGAAYAGGSVFFGGLRGEALYEARVRDEGAPELRVHFARELGRIRAVRVGPDGMLYFATSNRDGRGRPRAGDDQILRVNPQVFRR
jgi:glucose/arabinose dehydrogenase